MSGLREEPRGPARWLILDRPAQRNALSTELISALRGALVRADADAQARVICLTGSGEQAFCSGMDLASSAAAAQAGGIEAHEARRAYAV
ncbi:MAG TPA: enoyl-CoA hydratase/isomerase family protein, partial [Myxococcales bacterium]|nr:enoyl-CoA hydratase/isomerase family protein [Myxococcales bacterium]